MLNEIDRALISAEEKKFLDKNQHLKHLFDADCPIKSLDELFNKYETHELTEHFYDSSAPECEKCSKLDEDEDSCGTCQYHKNWQNSYECLSFCNWVDVYGPGIWDYSQEESDKLARDILVDAYIKTVKENGKLNERLFYHVTKDYLGIFYYNRDRARSDWWLIYHKK